VDAMERAAKEDVGSRAHVPNGCATIMIAASAALVCVGGGDDARARGFRLLPHRCQSLPVPVPGFVALHELMASQQELLGAHFHFRNLFLQILDTAVHRHQHRSSDVHNL